MTKISATIICFNEENNIRACIESLAWVDHIVIVDSGSTDRTLEIAKEYTNLVYSCDWPGHVEQKNRAIDLAPTDWVLSLDADERVSEKMRSEIEGFFRGDAKPMPLSFPRMTYYLGKWIRHGGWYPDRKLRVFNRKSARWGGTNPHDHVECDDEIISCEGNIYHYTYRDIAHHLEVIDFFTSIAARERDRKGKKFPLLAMLVGPPFKFFKMFIIKQGFRDGFAGFIVAVLGAYYAFLKDAKLWERRQFRDRGLDIDKAKDYQRGPQFRP